MYTKNETIFFHDAVDNDIVEESVHILRIHFIISIHELFATPTSSSLEARI